ncbi:MAG: hypothetical protein NT022_09800 [Deltaproteobacteria bacterium]|nr:hypothetical protein [Deltaproteobacteria bacterium]
MIYIVDLRLITLEKLLIILSAIYESDLGHLAERPNGANSKKQVMHPVRVEEPASDEKIGNAPTFHPVVVSVPSKNRGWGAVVNLMG